MNYIKHLNNFFTLMENDTRLTPSHISLYIALFRYWNYNRFKNPFPVYRENVMQLSKIGSKNTYHRCLKELHTARYIYYHPALSKYKPANISIFPIEIREERDPTQLKLFTASGRPSMSIKKETHICPNNDTQISTKNGTNAGTDIGTQYVPKEGQYIKHIQINKLETKAPAEALIEKREGIWEPVNGAARVPFVGHINDPPSLTDVERFFRESNYPELEAKKFFLHYQGIGWKILGVTPIANWQAVADKWMLNAANFNSVKNERRNGTDSGTDKEYTEPL